MSRIAPRVHQDQDAVERLESLVRRLAEAECVEITLIDGSVVCGQVSAVPSMQVFFDAAGTEGFNAVARIERPNGDSGVRRIWLDQVSDVVHLPNPAPPEPSTRVYPPDPNAPTTDHEA